MANAGTWAARLLMFPLFVCFVFFVFPSCLLLIGLGVVLLPVVARNYAVTGGIYLTTSQFGPNFFIGNNPAADGTYMSLRPGRGAPEYERQDATELAERALGRALTPAEVSWYWTDRALAFIADQPGRWLALMTRKVALLWNRSEMLDTESQETYEEASPLLALLARVGHFGVVVPLAFLGLLAGWPDRRRLWPILALLAAYAASVVVFYVLPVPVPDGAVPAAPRRPGLDLRPDPLRQRQREDRSRSSCCSYCSRSP